MDRSRICSKTKFLPILTDITSVTGVERGYEKYPTVAYAGTIKIGFFLRHVALELKHI